MTTYLNKFLSYLWRRDISLLVLSDFVRGQHFDPCKDKPRPDNRTVFVGGKNPSVGDGEAGGDGDPETVVVIPQKFVSNRVVSSKYTAFNFLPKNLWEQFHRIANFYFLIVSIVEIIIPSPVSPWTTIAPLIFVVVVTALKQGYEDFLRHKADREVNYKHSFVVRNGQLETVKAMEIQVGDIVKVELNSDIPCDLVMMSSADPQGRCYITTANLDGETNLKTFCCLPETRTFQTDASFDSLRGSIECQQPITDLYRFVGRFNLYDKDCNFRTFSLAAENVLLRGARLKNTHFVYGCAIYTGPETKISLNSKSKNQKYSRIEKKMNSYLLFYLAILVGFSVVWECITLGFYSFPNNQVSAQWYIPFYEDFWTANSWDQFIAVVEEFLSYMILCNYIIPISMYVTVELQKFFGSMFFEWDVEMFDELCNEPAVAITSDLNEELGQVEYLFTDKTGTLTENEMQFRRCSVSGVVYEQVGSELCSHTDVPVPGVPPEPIPALTSDIEDLLLALSLCHTVRVDRSASLASEAYSATGAEYEYQSSSPDEKALVEASSRLGTVFHGTKDDLIEIGVKGRIRQYKVHHVLDFDPTRKRMSVIVQDETGEILLICKGAETSLFEIITEGDLETIERHVNDFAVLGLRTLVVAWRRLTVAQFQTFDLLLKNARNVLENREEKVAEAYDIVERDFTLLGATAVEDKLQDGVFDTISSLRHAGIQVWVLTGDKEETAVNISYSAGHFNHDMEPLSLTKQGSSDECGATLDNFFQLLEQSRSRCEVRKHALIVDGKSLAWALDAHHELLRSVCEECVTVLCCRMSPIQKALVVRLMKNSSKKPTTAAIGDGANDVSMIQEAHVGLGIFGKEGRQAVRSSDYAFGRFRFLKRALLMHGHYFYVRLAILVQYFFYKNVAMITAQLYFTFFSAYSQQTIFSGYFLLWFNITFTALPIMLYGWFELHVPMSQILNNPSLYKTIRNNRLMSNWNFLRWNLLGLWHSLVFFFGTYFALAPGNSPFQNGWEYGVYDMGLVIMTACVLTVNIQLMTVSYYYNGIVVGGYIISIGGYFIMTAIYCVILWPFFSDTVVMYGSFETMLSSGYIWLLLMLLCVTALIPDLLLRAVNDNFSPLHDPSLHKVKPQNIYSGSTDDLLTVGANMQQAPRHSLSTISGGVNRSKSSKATPSSVIIQPIPYGKPNGHAGTEGTELQIRYVTPGSGANGSTGQPGGNCDWNDGYRNPVGLSLEREEAYYRAYSNNGLVDDVERDVRGRATAIAPPPQSVATNRASWHTFDNEAYTTEV